MKKIGKNDKKPSIEKDNKKPSDILGNLKDSAKEFYISKGMLLFVLGAILLLALSLFIYFIFDDEGLWKDDEVGKPSTYTNNVKLSTTEGIKVDVNPLIKENLLLKGYTQEEIDNLTEADIIRIFDMSEKLGRNITSLDDCSEVELLWCISDEYSKYLEDADQLKFLLNAEIVTQYPKLNLSNSDLVDGIIQFKRTIINPDDSSTTEVMLKYISSSEFDAKYQNYINTGNRDVFNYFTVDDEENVIIATWTQENGEFSSNNVEGQNRNKIQQGYNQDKIKNEYDQRYSVDTETESLITAKYATYTVNKEKIYYKSLIQQYTMPFEYLWALLVMGESYDFVEGLAQLAYDSKITIGIFDSMTTTVNVNRKEYTEEFRESFEIHEREKVSQGQIENSWELVDSNDWVEEAHPYYAENKVTTKENSIQFDLIYADTWIVELAVGYQRIDKDPTTFSNPNIIKDEEWSDNGSYVEYDERIEKIPIENPFTNETTDKNNSPNNPLNGGVFNNNNSTTGTTNNSTNSSNNPLNGGVFNKDNSTNDEKNNSPTYKDIIIEIKRSYYKEKKTTGQANMSTQITSSNKYEKQPSKPKEKTDPNAATNNFVKLLKNDEKAYGLLTNSGVMVWLVDVLEQNESTSDMVDLTIYLIKKTKDPDDTELSFDFSIYDPENFNSISGIYGNSIAEKLWFSLIDAGYSEYAAAGALGNIYAESGIIANNLQNSCEERLGSDEEYTNRINSGDYLIEDFITDSAGYGLCQWTTAGRKKGLYEYTIEQGYNIDSADKQILYFLAEITGKGEAAEFISGRRTAGAIKNEGITSTHDDWANATSVDNATLHFMRFFESPESKDSLSNRQVKANEYYKQFNGKEKPIVDKSAWTYKGVSCPQYKQSNALWANNPYNYEAGKTIRDGGCGACALAMAVSGLTESSVTPDIIVSYLNSIGTNTVYDGYNSSKAVASKYGLTLQKISRNDKTSIDAALDAGKCLIFSIKSNGIYTGDGHYIMCYGREGDKYYVLESANYYIPDRAYEFDEVFTSGSQGIFALGR